ncbi:hypothetical protein [Bradyrhizobium sp. SZCCHNS3053]|uniref:hypothetical protein n=1 Tax=Bradyrhizobium sp. SZCCHNS3053 TaxID=3057322 RepID=UPI0029166861|nr:hypothetical protein [Bradyrhizobium sp. SZCCHNS3053]
MDQLEFRRLLIKQRDDDAPFLDVTAEMLRGDKPETFCGVQLTDISTSTFNIECDIELSEETQAELAAWWEKLIADEMMRTICGEASEYAQCLRAAGAKV